MSDDDLSSGMPTEKEYMVTTAPTEPFWSENILFAFFDAKADVGVWLHLGSVPNDWRLWEDRIYITLPGDGGVLWVWAHGHPRAEELPKGAALSFECIEPFKRWRLKYDGFAQYATNAEMENAYPPDSVRRRVFMDLEVECSTPVWDAHKAKSVGGKGGMDTQSWAKEHYEQLFRCTGVIRLDNAAARPNTVDNVAGSLNDIAITEGVGWRDHSRGPRGGETRDPWGGHFIVGCQFPSGKALIFSQYWKPDGVMNLNGGCVVDKDGKFHYAEVLATPFLSHMAMQGERLPIHLKWDGGEIDSTMLTTKSIWIPRERKHTVGQFKQGKFDMYVLNFGPIEWDGEVGYAYIERSSHLNDLPKSVRPPE